jgi:hypothetical protein
MMIQRSVLELSRLRKSSYDAFRELRQKSDEQSEKCVWFKFGAGAGNFWELNRVQGGSSIEYLHEVCLAGVIGTSLNMKCMLDVIHSSFTDRHLQVSVSRHLTDDHTAHCIYSIKLFER